MISEINDISIGIHAASNEMFGESDDRNQYNINYMDPTLSLDFLTWAELVSIYSRSVVTRTVFLL